MCEVYVNLMLLNNTHNMNSSSMLHWCKVFFFISGIFIYIWKFLSLTHSLSLSFGKQLYYCQNCHQHVVVVAIYFFILLALHIYHHQTLVYVCVCLHTYGINTRTHIGNVIRLCTHTFARYIYININDKGYIT